MKLQIVMQKSANFKTQYRIYYEDTDAGGVVYYANYLKFFERARTDFLRSLGILQNDLMLKSNSAFVVRKCQIEYLKPAKLDDLIEVDVAIERLGGASINMKQKITKNEDILAILDVEIVHVDVKNFHPKKIDKDLRKKIIPFPILK